MLRLTPPLLAVVAMLALQSVAIAADPVLSQFPPDKSICFGRTYTDAHLKSHPRQDVAEFYLYRSLDSDLASEEKPITEAAAALEASEWEAQSRRGGRENTADDPTLIPYTSLNVLVRQRASAAMLTQTVECHRTGADSFACGVDCDGGGFSVKSGADGLALQIDRETGGLRVQAGCSSGDESAPAVRIGQDKDGDDHNFKLESLPPSACVKARDESRPHWVKSGAPLSERFATRPTACYVLRAGNSGEAVPGLGDAAAMKIKIIGPVKEEEGHLALTARVMTLLSGTTKFDKTLDCTASGYAFDCRGEPGGARLYRDGDKGLVFAEEYYEGGDVAQLFGRPGTDRFGPFHLEDQPDINCEQAP